MVERTAPSATPPADGTRGAAPALLPAGDQGWRTVVMAWVVSRVLAVVTLVVAGSLKLHETTFATLWSYDGAWYVGIADTGYGTAPVHGVQSHWPFFPLFPGLIKLVHVTGLPTTVAAVVVANAAFVVALLGVRRLALRHLGTPGRADLAVWVVALFPASAVFSMAYPSSLFLAATVWAFVLLDERRDLAAGLVAAAAALIRPNGAVVVVALAVALLFDGGRPTSTPWRRLGAVCGPPVLGLAVWCSILWHWAGDPLVFWEAKSAWDEVRLDEFLADPRRSEVPHVLLGGAALLLVLLMVRRLPPSWSVFTFLYLAPSLLVGVVGMARYANECFPVPIAAAMVLARVAPQVRRGVLACGAIGVVVLAVAIARLAIVP